MDQCKNWTVRGADGQLIYGDSHMPHDGGVAVGAVLLLHGFKGYKDYGFIPRLAESLAWRGFVVHRFNFSHSGMTLQVERFGRPDLFERDTWGKQVADVEAVLDAIRSRQIQGAGLPIVLFGHSRGGTTALLAAAEVGRAGGRLAGIAAAAAPADAVRLSHAERETLRREGRIASPSSRTGQVLHVGRAWLEEVEADPERFDPCLAIASLDLPVLLLHGTADATVAVRDAHRLHEASHERAKLELIEGASHTFDATNPLPVDAEPPAATRRLIQEVGAFAERCSKMAVSGD